MLLAADRGTEAEAEAKALMAKAAEHYQAVGRDQAIADFNKKDGGFVDRDLYVWCYDNNKTLVAHGMNAKLIGMKVGTLHDADGKDFTTEIYNDGMANGSGRIEYKWTNPLSKKIEANLTFYQKMGQDLCMVGYYK